MLWGDDKVLNEHRGPRDEMPGVDNGYIFRMACLIPARTVRSEMRSMSRLFASFSHPLVMKWRRWQESRGRIRIRNIVFVVVIKAIPVSCGTESAAFVCKLQLFDGHDQACKVTARPTFLFRFYVQSLMLRIGLARFYFVVEMAKEWGAWQCVVASISIKSCCA